MWNFGENHGELFTPVSVIHVLLYCREYKRKIDSAKRRLSNLQSKQKETVKLASMSERTDEKINDLQLAVSKMRQQQEELQKKLKQEHDKKEKLEVLTCGQWCLAIISIPFKQPYLFTWVNLIIVIGVL